MSNINKIKDYMKIENDTGGWIKQDIVPCYDKCIIPTNILIIVK